MPVPEIVSLTPNVGYLTTPVVIEGTRFDETGNVTFNGIVATPISWSNTTIVVPVPTGAETGNVVVENAAYGVSVGVPFEVQHVNVYQSEVMMSMWVPQEHQLQTGIEVYLTLRKFFRGYVQNGEVVRCCRVLEDWVDWKPEIRIDIQDEIIGEEWHTDPTKLYHQGHADYVCHSLLHRWCLVQRTDYII